MSRLISLSNALGIERKIAKQTIYDYVTLSLHLKKHKGKSHASKLLKEFYNVLKMKCLGCKTHNTSTWSATSKRGLPKKVEKVISRFNLSEDNHVRWLLSLFSLYETWKEAKVVADLQTLTCKQSSDWSPEEKLNFKRSTHTIVNSMRRAFMIKKIKEDGLKDYLSLKGGPYGPATLSSHHDAKALVANVTLKRKISKLHHLISTDAKGSFDIKVSEISKYSDLKAEEYITLKTIAIPDKGPKVRTITIGNYFLQRTLKPVHNGLMDTLRSIPEDGIHRQSSAAARIAQWTAQGNQPWCFDLSSATDRFPIAIQHIVMKEVYPEISLQWYSIMRKARSYNPETKTYFEFSVGQPMGLYSSWPAFTLTHHVLIRYAFEQVNLDFRNRYCIIGDDVAILDSKAAVRYKELILSLGISISEAKSITPLNKELDSLPSGELAKRYYRDGKELTPVRPYELESFSGKGWPLFKEFIPKLIDRWGYEELYKNNFFTPIDVETSFLTWVDKAHRKKLLLTVTRPPVPPYLKGLEPGWWPQDLMGMMSYDSSTTQVLRRKHNKICKDLHDIRTKQDLLSCIDNTKTSISSYISHPLVSSLKILDSDLLAIFSDNMMGNHNFERIYSLGINIELLKSIVIDGKNVKDYQSLQLKRSTAIAQFTLDVWKEMLSKFRFKPERDDYPRFGAS